MVTVLRKSTVTNKIQPEPQTRNTCAENNIPIIVSERISPDLSKAAIREIVAHTIDDGTPRDMSCDNDNNTNKQMLEVNVKVSYKHNEQDKTNSINPTPLNRSIDMTTNETRLNHDNIERRI